MRESLLREAGVPVQEPPVTDADGSRAAAAVRAAQDAVRRLEQAAGDAVRHRRNDRERF
jgi:hypothetical protein